MAKLLHRSQPVLFSPDATGQFCVALNKFVSNRRTDDVDNYVLSQDVGNAG